MTLNIDNGRSASVRQVPAESVAPPAESVAPPVEGVAPPVEGVAPPVEGVAPPAEGVAPPASSPETADTEQDAVVHEELVAELVDALAWHSARDRAAAFTAFKAWHRGALSLVHLNVIAILEAEGPISMSRLADLLDVSVASATGIVSRMEQRSYVRRQHDTADRRVVQVHLTEAGGCVFDELSEARRQRLTPVVSELSSEEIRGFIVGLRALNAARARILAATDGPIADGGSGGEGAARPLDSQAARDIS